MLHWGPPCNVSSSTFEHAQGHLRDTATMSTKDSESYGFQHYTTWQCQCFAEIQQEDKSNNSYWHSAFNACEDLLINKDKSITYWGVHIHPGSIIMQIKEYSPNFLSIIESGQILSLFQFFEIQSIDIKNQQVHVFRIKSPKGSQHSLLPFQLTFQNREVEILNLSQCNRIVASVPWSWDKSDDKYILPTRYI